MINDLTKELLELILLQQEEIEKLRRKIDRINQYVEVYEDYIRGE